MKKIILFLIVTLFLCSFASAYSWETVYNPDNLNNPSNAFDSNYSTSATKTASYVGNVAYEFGKTFDEPIYVSNIYYNITENGGSGAYQSEMKIYLKTYDNTSWSTVKTIYYDVTDGWLDGTQNFNGNQTIEQSIYGLRIDSSFQDNGVDRSLSYYIKDLEYIFSLNTSRLTVNATNAQTNATINNFNVTATEVINESNTLTIETTTGEAQLNLTNGTYNVVIDAPEYALYNNEAVVNVSYDVETLHSFELYDTNSVLIMNIYNATSGELITNYTEIQTEQGDNITTYNTTTGSKFIYGLETGECLLRFDSEGFQITNHVITVGNRSFQTLDVYLSESADETTVFTFKDKETTNIIESVSLSISKLVNDEWKVINVLSSDVTGKITFAYDDTLRYRFIATKTGYDAKQFELNPIIFSSYNVFLDVDIEVQTPEYQKASIFYTPSRYSNNLNNSITFTFSSVSGSFVSYGYDITFNGTTISDTGSNAIGGTFNNSLEILNAVYGDYVEVNYTYTLSDDTIVTRSYIYYIFDTETENYLFTNVGDDYGMGFFERLLLITILIVIMGGTAYIFGGIVASGVVILIILAYFISISFISAWVLIPSMVFITFAVIWRSLQ